MKLKWDTDEWDTFIYNLSEHHKLTSEMHYCAEDLAKILRGLLKHNTPVVTGTLRRGWDTGYKITKVKGGWMVELENKVDYARWVNYGHKSKNQFGGPYVVKHRTVPLEGRWGQTATEYYVYGHFFVEKSILTLEEHKQVEKIIFDHLRQWWSEVLYR